MGSVSSPRPCLQSRVSPQAVRPHQVNQPPAIDLWPHAPAASHTDRQRAGGSSGCVTRVWEHSEGFPGPLAESRSPTVTNSSLWYICCPAGQGLLWHLPHMSVFRAQEKVWGSPYPLSMPVPASLSGRWISRCLVGSPPTSVTGIVGSMGASASWGTQSQPTGKTATAH